MDPHALILALLAGIVAAGRAPFVLVAYNIRDNPQLRKALRDLWENKARTLLVLMALMIGIFAIGSVLTAYSILSPEMDRNYTETLPADAVFRIDNANVELAEQVAQLPNVTAVLVGRQSTGRVEIKPDEWLPIVLFIRSEFEAQSINRFYHEQGRGQPQTGEILLEANSLDIMPQHVGDTLTIQTASGDAQPIAFVGTVHDPAQAPAWMENRAYGYLTTETANMLGLSSTFDSLLVRFTDSGDRTMNQAAANTLAADLRAQGFDILEITVPVPGRHPHADQMNALLFLLASFGAMALLLSGVLVSTMIEAVMRRQLPQIGIMKAIGARGWQIRRIYATAIVILGLLAAIPAIILSQLAGVAYADFAGDMLNFVIEMRRPPLWVYAVQIAGALLIPLCCAALPILRGSRVSVREALDARGGIPALNFWTQSKWLGRLSNRPLLLLAVRNTLRQPKRALLTLSTMTIGGAIFMGALNSGQSWTETINRGYENYLADFTIDFAEPRSPDELKQLLLSVDGVNAVEITSALVGTPVSEANNPGNLSMPMLPYEATLMLTPYALVHGREPVEPTEIIASERIAQLIDVAIGDVIEIQVGAEVAQWTLVGLIDQWNPTLYALSTGLAAQYADASMQQKALIQVEGRCPVYEPCSTADVPAVMRATEHALSAANLNVLQVNSAAIEYKVLADHVVILVNFLALAAIFVAIVGSFGLMVAMSLNVLERAREIGVMRSLGSDSRTILKLILMEGLALAWLSWLFAIVLSWPASMLIGNVAGNIFLKAPLALAVSQTGIMGWLGIVTIIALIATALPAIRATNRAVSTVLAYE